MLKDYLAREAVASIIECGFVTLYVPLIDWTEENGLYKKVRFLVNSDCYYFTFKPKK